jgi:hypothetical protein
VHSVRGPSITIIIALTTACAPAEMEEDNPGSGMRSPDIDELSVELQLRFDIHRLLEDDDVTGGENITADMVQEFLELKGSFLANYVDPVWGQSAAQLIVDQSRASDISPLYMLARIQTESSLVQSGSSSGLVQATGCGCPDGSGCNPNFRGFGNQVRCGAEKMRGYLEDLDTLGRTVTNWRVNVGRNTSDPCWVVPQNRATAALYTYTPWVGAYGIQCTIHPNIGGSTLVALAFNRFANEYDWTAAAPPAGCASGTVDATLPQDACVQSAWDGVWRQCRSGAWQLYQSGSPACTASWGWCTSGTLGRDVAPRTCVQARWDQRWYQCGENARFVLADQAPIDGTGPAGACAASFSLQ